MIYGKVGQRGQVVIPKKIREEKGIQPGDTLIFSITGDDIIIKKLDPVENVSLVDLLKSISYEDGFVEKLRSEWG